MMLLLILYNVRSERELISTIPERLDWLWFLGYDLEDEIPNHSVLSKARTRWGVKAFKNFFERMILLITLSQNIARSVCLKFRLQNPFEQQPVKI